MIFPALGIAVLAALLLAFLAVVRIDANTGPGGESTEATGGEGVHQVSASPREDVPSALANPSDPALPPALVDVAEISAVLRPEGIPSIDDPKFQPADTVEWLDAREPIISVTVSGQTRGYPVQVLTFHEIVNDTFGEEPIAVTYCPLCNSALAFERNVDGRVLDFGTSGMLRNNNLVMYDRQTESLWQQASSEAIVGVLVGTELARVSAPVLSWGEFLAANPDAPVLTRDTGASRAYGVNPYERYDTNGFIDATDTRLGAMTRVAGFGSDETAVAVVAEWLFQQGRAAKMEVDGEPVTVWVLSDTASALDTSIIADGRTIGSIVAFVPTVEGRTLTFTATDSAAVDDQTGSTWDVTGTATDGPLAGTTLTTVPVVDTFWFAWSGFETDTTIVGSPRE